MGDGLCQRHNCGNFRAKPEADLKLKEEETRGQELEKAREECLFFGHETSLKRAVGNSAPLRGLFRNQGVLGFSCL